MNFSREELLKLAGPFAFCVVLLAGGAALIWWSKIELARARGVLTAVQTERSQANERRARIAEEEREVQDKLAIYERLRALHILGPEQRLEWADAMKRIRSARELSDLRYRVDRQKQIAALAAKPATVDFYASRMKVELALLHEGDLFPFLQDLRDSGNAYYSVQRCALSRLGVSATAPNLLPRVQAECEIDLITILDRGAKTAAARRR